MMMLNLPKIVLSLLIGCGIITLFIDSSFNDAPEGNNEPETVEDMSALTASVARDAIVRMLESELPLNIPGPHDRADERRIRARVVELKQGRLDEEGDLVLIGGWTLNMREKSFRLTLNASTTSLQILEGGFELTSNNTWIAKLKSASVGCTK